MYVSARLDYALRALAALPPPSGPPLSATQLAETEEIPLIYLRTALNELRTWGLLVHERGPHGGYSLTRPTTDITLGDVVAALRIPPVEVHPNPRSTDELSRSMSRVWKQVEDSTLDILTSITVAQVVEGKACGGDPMMPASPMEGG